MEKCFTKLSLVFWCHVQLVQSDLFCTLDKHVFFFFSMPVRGSFSCRTLYFPLLCLFVLVYMPFFFLSPPPSFHRASEQKHINVTAVHLNGSSARQLDLDLYLGVYAGDARRANIAFFFLCVSIVCGCECGRHSMNRPTVAWLRPKAFKAHCMCGRGLSCTRR